jgi:hypothetical protein
LEFNLLTNEFILAKQFKDQTRKGDFLCKNLELYADASDANLS